MNLKWFKYYNFKYKAICFNSHARDRPRHAGPDSAHTAKWRAKTNQHPAQHKRQQLQHQFTTAGVKMDENLITVASTAMLYDKSNNICLLLDQRCITGRLIQYLH